MSIATQRKIDYSDCVRNFREYAARLGELARGELTRRDKFQDVVPYLEKTARSLEENQLEPSGKPTSAPPVIAPTQPTI